MSERRPHWTDDLIEAVRDGMSTEMVAAIGGESVATNTYIPSDDDVFNVIAAVEDWQTRKLSASAEQLDKIADWQVMKVMLPLWHWAQAEAAIQRVREVLANPRDFGEDGYSTETWAEALEAVREALDGPE